ncbi:MAG: DUF86 domain-containing protein [Nanoarchaeota archaeon]|nr:DUF86 domain-containing protein [Nanoarchaeota archaeon]
MQKYKVYLDDIIESIKRIEEYTKNVSYEDFIKNKLLIDGTVRNLEIIGEAVKRISIDIKKKYPDVEWKKIAGLRDILIHEYSGINLKIVWDVIVNNLPKLKRNIKKMMKDISKKT